MDDRAGDVFCSTDRDLKKQGGYGASFSGAGGSGRRFALRYESIFFDPKSCFYYSAKPAYNFDMRILRDSGGFHAFLHPDFEYDINNSQKYFFPEKGLDKHRESPYNRNYFKSPLGQIPYREISKIFLTFYF